MPIAIVIAGALVAGSLLYTKGGSTPKPEKVDFKITAQDRVLGNPKAKITIVEFSDFQCPYCRKFFNDTYPKLKSQYIDTGKAKLVYRHFPLAFHDMALPSAMAAECAGEQGKFWEFHDKIFQEQTKLNPEELSDPRAYKTIEYTTAHIETWAGEIGLDVPKLKACMDANTYADKIAFDNQNGTAAGVEGTPTSFVSGAPIVGAQAFEVFVQAFGK